MIVPIAVRISVGQDSVIGMRTTNTNRPSPRGRGVVRNAEAHRLDAWARLGDSLHIRHPECCLDKKLKAIGAFRSQKQISSLIENVRHCGPEEYIRAIDFKLYHPETYHSLFEEKKPITLVR